MTGYEYDVAISYAGEQRDIAEELAVVLRQRHPELRVFLDRLCAKELWGKDMVIYLHHVFSEASKFCIILVSREYVQKEWTLHELKSALGRMIHEEEYILQVKIDRTDLPGVPRSINYVCFPERSIEEIAEMVLSKVGYQVPSLDKAEVTPSEPVFGQKTEIESQPQPLVSTSEVPQAYCVKCRASKTMVNPRRMLSRNRRWAMQGTCPDCGTKIMRFLPRKPDVDPRFSVSITPIEQIIPAGASVSYGVGISDWVPPTLSSPRWSVGELSEGWTAELVRGAYPYAATLVIHTFCSTPEGLYSITVLGSVSETTRSTRAVVRISGRLAESRPGMFNGSFADNTIVVRRGGPSTLEYGPFLVLQFCKRAEPRLLKVIVDSVISDPGAPLVQPPRFSLFQSFEWPVPDYLQTMSGNVREVARNDGWKLEWNITNGLYVLVFLRSPFEASYAAERRPAAVTYSVDIQNI